MANLTKEQMLEILMRHDAAEGRGDLDAVMATVSLKPFYEFHPAGITLDTVDAVRELYRTALPGYVKLLANARQIDFWTNDTGCAAEFEFVIPCGSAKVHHARLFVVIEFDGDLLQAERGYIDFIFEKHHTAVLGEALLAYPGVRVINAATSH